MVNRWKHGFGVMRDSDLKAALEALPAERLRTGLWARDGAAPGGALPLGF